MMTEKSALVMDASLAIGATTLPFWLDWLPALSDVTLTITPIFALVLILIRIAVGVRDLIAKDK